MSSAAKKLLWLMILATKNRAALVTRVRLSQIASLDQVKNRGSEKREASPEVSPSEWFTRIGH